MTDYATIVEFLADPSADRPAIPPGGSCGDKDNAHMTYLANTLRKFGRAEQLRKLQNYAVILESIAPGDPCVKRVMEWHGQIAGI